MVRNAVPGCAGCAVLGMAGSLGPTSPQGWLRCEQKYPCGPKTSIQRSQVCCGSTSPGPTGNSLSEQGKAPPQSWDRGAAVPWCGGGYSPHLPLPFR